METGRFEHYPAGQFMQTVTVNDVSSFCTKTNVVLVFVQRLCICFTSSTHFLDDWIRTFSDRLKDIQFIRCSF